MNKMFRLPLGNLFIVSTMILFFSILFSTNRLVGGGVFHLPIQRWVSERHAVDYQMFQEYGAAYRAYGDSYPDGRNPYPPFATSFSGFVLQHVTPEWFQLLIAAVMIFVCASVSLSRGGDLLFDGNIQLWGNFRNREGAV